MPYRKLTPEQREAKRLRDAEAHRMLVQRMARTNRLSPRMFDVLVENWNGLNAMERRRRAERCKGGNHDIVTTPYGTPVCRRCVQHFDS